MGDYPCISCSRNMREREHAVECDSCGLWQHRRCGTGINITTYREAVRAGRPLPFVCNPCLPPQDEPKQQEPEPTEKVKEVDNVGLNFPGPTLESMRVDVNDDIELFLPPVRLPNQINESSLMEESIQLANCPVTEECTYTVIQGGTTRGKDLLVEAPGYSYTIKRQSTKTRFWWCSVRRKGNRCPATVSETNGRFTVGAKDHCHPSEPGCLVNRQLARQVKDAVLEYIFKPAMVMVEERIKSLSPTDIQYMQAPERLVRKANRHRQNQRPEASKKRE